MTRICVSTVLLLSFITPQYISAQNIQSAKDFLKLELSFGDDEKALGEDYILVYPTGVEILNNGNILITDEATLKIYTPEGIPVKTVGRKGQGPGEYEASQLPILSASGILSVWGSESYYNFYDENLNFLESVNHSYDPKYSVIRKEYNVSMMYASHIVRYNENEKIIRLGGVRGTSSISIIAYQNKDEIEVLKLYDKEVYFPNNKGSLSVIPVFGGLHLVFLPDNRIAYMLPSIDRINNFGEYSYKLIVSDINGDNESTIIKSFEPVPLRENRLNNKNQGFQRLIKDFPFKASLSNLKTDDKYIYAFTNTYLESKEILVDIFEIESQNYVKSVYFPFIPYKFKNGKAYNLKVQKFVPPNWREMQGLTKEIIERFEKAEKEAFFPVLEVYKIEPELYKTKN